MSATTRRWAEEVKASVDGLKSLRDEVKLQVRLGNMNARTKFKKLEHQLDTQQLNVRKRMKELTAELRLLKSQLIRDAQANGKR